MDKEKTIEKIAAFLAEYVAEDWSANYVNMHECHKHHYRSDARQLIRIIEDADDN